MKTIEYRVSIGRGPDRITEYEYVRVEASNFSSAFRKATSEALRLTDAQRDEIYAVEFWQVVS